MELIWLAALAVAYRDKRVRGLADLLALKWAVSYCGFLGLAEWVPMISDALVAMLLLVSAKLTCRREAIVWLFMASLLTHAAYWSCWEHGIWWPDTYKVLLAALYTLMWLVLMPWEKVRAWADRHTGLYLGWRDARTGKVGPDRKAG